LTDGRPFKRILVLADTHCGHKVGLTHPDYWDNVHDKFHAIQEEMWDSYTSMVDEYKPYDYLLFNGDAIDGRGERSGGTELITADRKKQAHIAQRAIQYADCENIYMTYGTPYHVSSDGEDWEAILASDLGAKIESHGFYEINGRIIDMKHKIGSSNIPHGRLTALAREIMWNRVWLVDREQQPRADILIRSHAHYFEQAEHMGCIGFITPCLQGMGSKYGARQCSGTIDFGILVIDISDDGEITWKCPRVVGEVQTAQVTKLC
jgi:hypothetical protein